MYGKNTTGIKSETKELTISQRKNWQIKRESGEERERVCEKEREMGIREQTRQKLISLSKS